MTTACSKYVRSSREGNKLENFQAYKCLRPFVLGGTITNRVMKTSISPNQINRFEPCVRNFHCQDMIKNRFFLLDDFRSESRDVIGANRGNVLVFPNLVVSPNRHKSAG